ncbi:MAG TPA: hypothetical protein VGL40_09875 [Bacillota bacterium]|jgi:hypothetical protein
MDRGRQEKGREEKPEEKRAFEAKERRVARETKDETGREKNESNEEVEMRNIAAECAEYTPIYHDQPVSLSATEALERSCGTCEHFNGGECDIYQRESGTDQSGNRRGRQ